MSIRYHINRVEPGGLFVVDNEAGPIDAETKEPSGAPVTWPIPDAEFWAWLDKGDGLKYREAMEAENPDRLKRARAFVGRLRSEKQCLTTAGYTRATLASDRPVGKIEIEPKQLPTPRSIDHGR